MSLFDRMFGGLLGRRSTPPPPPPALPEPQRADSANGMQLMVWAPQHDSVVNPLSGIGGGNDKGAAGQPDVLRIPLSDDQLRALYGYNGIARLIVNLLPNRACRKGWSVPGLGAEEDRRLRTFPVVEEAMNMARLYGGSAVLLVTEDDIPKPFRARPKDWLTQPLDSKRVGKLHAIHVFDAFEAVPTRWDSDIRSPTFRNPSMWSITSPGFTGWVHGSRIAFFRGARRPPSEMQGGWWTNFGSRMPDDSILQVIWDEICRLTQTMQGGATLAQELRQGVFKVGNLAQTATGDEAAALQAKMTLIARAKSILNMILLGPKDEYQSQSQAPTGFEDLSDAAKSMLAAVSGYPEVILFGDTPSGLNTDGESSHEGFRQQISSYQESNREPIEQIYTVAYAAQDGPTGGKIPKGWSLDFHALNEPSEKEKADTRFVVAQADALYLDRGVFGPEDVAKSRFGKEGYSLEMQPVPIPDPAEEDTLAAARKLLAGPTSGGAPGAGRDPGAQDPNDPGREPPPRSDGSAGSAPRDLEYVPADRTVETGNPYRIEERGGEFLVVKVADGRVMGKHPTREEAERQFRALEAAEHRSDAPAIDSCCIVVPAADPGLQAAVTRAIGQQLAVERAPHVTVLYLGEGIDDTAVREVLDVVTDEAARAMPGTLERGTVRPFPEDSKGTPIVVEFGDSWAIQALHDVLLTRLAHLVTTRQHRQFRAHLTVGYASAPLSAEAIGALAGVDATEVRVPISSVAVRVGGSTRLVMPVGGAE